jgi:hypothetical protein
MMMQPMGRLGKLLARRRRPRPEATVSTPVEASPEDLEAAIQHVAGLEATLQEVAHERDVSIARAIEAEEHERLTQERLDTLRPLGARVEAAERRALDAERRLEEIAERVRATSQERDHPE